MSKIKEAYTKLRQKPLLLTAVMTVVLCLFIEALSRHNPFGGFIFLALHPLCFIYDSVLIFTTLYIGFLFSKRGAVQTLVSLIWIALGITNFVLLFFRSTPFSFVDITLLGYAMQLIDIYLNGFEIALIAILLLAGIGAIVFAFVRAKKKVRPKKLLRTVITLIVLIALLIGCGSIIGRFNDNSIVNAYDKFGFAYCFTRSVFDVGIDSPSEYDENTVEDIMAELPQAASSDSAPNVVIVQLESFFDVSHIKALSFSEDPIPNFTKLKSECPYGFLSMPSIGAGTANSEFEVLTGMNLDFFGFNEYPYKTVLQTKTCESLAYNLKASGISSAVAIHNNTATFYDRNKVFSKLGFDRFVSEEYMDGIEYNELGWAKDDILTEEITKALDSTEGSDLVYAITVQSHGKYPDDQIDEAPAISVFSNDDSKDGLMSFEYYVNQINEVDAFIGDLMQAIEVRGEDTVVVFFGDHLPNLELAAEDLDNNNLYQTEYVIWNNCGLDFEGGDIEAYELSAKILGILGAEDGIITRYHLHTDNNLDDMKTLEYDMLYGDYLSSGGEPRYEATELKLGYDSQYVTGLREGDKFTVVEGGGFNESTKVLLDGKEADTLLYDSGNLIVMTTDLRDGMKICAAQVAGDGTVLSQTEELTYTVAE